MVVGDEKNKYSGAIDTGERPPVHNRMNTHAPCCAAITAQEQVARVTKG